MCVNIPVSKKTLGLERLAGSLLNYFNLLSKKDSFFTIILTFFFLLQITRAYWSKQD